jgi:hypothetical protein
MSATTRTRVGELRPSQLLWSFGVGAVVDLPNFSVIVLGLDDWDPSKGDPIGEERLLAAVKRTLGPQVTQLLAPPRVSDGDGPPNPFGDGASTGVPVSTFPEWLRCPICQLLAPIDTRLFDLKPSPFRPDQVRFVHTTCGRAKGRPPTAVPARFLVACLLGHVDDFPWAYYVHRGSTGCRGTLSFFEIGASLETSNLFVKCNECDQSRSMIDAFDPAQHALPACRGHHPHLRGFDQGCSAPLKAILLGASNGWFPETRSVLSVPTRAGKLAQLVEDKWLFLAQATSKEILGAFLAAPGFGEFAAFDLDDVWHEVEARRNELEGEGGTEADDVEDLKRPEWEVFASPDPALNGRDFWLTPSEAPAAYAGEIAGVVLAERLREVNALVGFTRLKSAAEFNPLEAKQRRVPLSSTSPTWVPATEVRGEGVFLRFDLGRLGSWVDGQGPKDRSDRLLAAHRAWRQARGLEPAEDNFPGEVYVLLHSLSHVLMREVALECGYNAASIRERIYASRPDEPLEMAGLLVYTAAPDSEGTLGGLVSLGKPEELARLLERALRHAELCASDPLCSEHDPSRDGTLHGAACHACLFAPETSCEIGNRYLDRALIVPTFRIEDSALFRADRS